jgi:hypothetical protein
LKICIPSLERSENLDVLKLCGMKDVKIYVKTHEIETYAKVVGDKHVFEVPEDKIGLGAIRRFIVDDNRDEDYFVILDDDVIGITYRFEDKMVEIANPDHFRGVLQNSYQVALDLGTPLFGYEATMNPNFYTQMDMFSFAANVPSCHGIIPSLLGDINYDPRLIVMNDYDIALQCKYYKRYMFVDKRYNLRWSKKWFNKGGSSTLRTKNLLQEMSKILMTKYGSSVIKPNPSKIQYDIKFPF